MRAITLTCRLITPMFMAGADRKTPELRPSEFKGMMRWWWRAIKAEDDIEKLKKEEAEIFGGTGEGEGRSKVRLRLIYQNLQTGSNLKQDFNLNWRFDKAIGSLTGRDRGIGYILYSTVLPNRERHYFKPGGEFEFTILSLDEISFKKALASLWLSIYLGGFGTRSRRGGGNIEIISFDGDVSDLDLDFICKATNGEELKFWLKINYDKVKELIKQSENGTNKYTNLKGAKVLIFEGKDNWKTALNFFGEVYMDFRMKYRNRIFETAAFGMPVIHNRPNVKMVPYENTNRKLSDRWASPLIFKVIKSDKLYFPVIVKLSPGGVPFVGKEIKGDREIQSFDETLVNEFLNSFKNKVELAL